MINVLDVVEILTNNMFMPKGTHFTVSAVSPAASLFVAQETSKYPHGINYSFSDAEFANGSLGLTYSSATVTWYAPLLPGLMMGYPIPATITTASLPTPPPSGGLSSATGNGIWKPGGTSGSLQVAAAQAAVDLKVGDYVRIKANTEGYAITTPGSEGAIYSRTSADYVEVDFYKLTGCASATTRYIINVSDLERITAPSSTKHQHQPKQYIGFTDSFTYCETCNEKLG